MNLRERRGNLRGQMETGFSHGLKRTYVEFEEEALGGSPTLQPSSSNDSPLGVCSKDVWGGYLCQHGLIDERELGRTPKPFPQKGQRLREYRKSMAKLVGNFKTETISNYNLNAVYQKALKRQPAENKQPKYEDKNEPTLRVIDSANTIIRDSTTHR